MGKDPRRVATGRIGALKLHGLYDSRILTANARSAALRVFRDQAAAAANARGEKVSDEELDRRALYLRRSHMAAMAYTREKGRKNKTAAGIAAAAVSKEVAGGSSTSLPQAV